MNKDEYAILHYYLAKLKYIVFEEYLKCNLENSLIEKELRAIDVVSEIFIVNDDNKQKIIDINEL